MMPNSSKGILGDFYDPYEAVAAAAKVHEAGWTHFDVLTPFPIHGMDAAIGPPAGPDRIRPRARQA